MTVLLRSRVMRKCQARFCSRMEGATPSLRQQGMSLHLDSTAIQRIW
jgi:hypothetical protein